MAPEEAVKRLNALNEDDPESAHSNADDILLMVLDTNGLKEVADAYKAAQRKVGFWYA
jgi:hypothetical protein